MFSTARNVTVAEIHTNCDIPHGTLNTSMGACRQGQEWGWAQVTPWNRQKWISTLFFVWRSYHTDLWL